MDCFQRVCFICSEACLEKNLIHMQTNSLIIESTYIDFAKLINDLTGINIDDEHHNLICIGCKDQLTQFYVMKQRVKSLHMSPGEIRKSQITSHVANFIDQTSSEEFVVTKFKNLLAIHPDTNCQAFQDQLNICSCLLENESEVLMNEETAELGIVQMKDEFEPFFEEIIEQHEDSSPEDQEKLKTSSQRMRKPPQAPKELDQLQREWIKTEAKQNMVVLETTFGNKTQWCCSKCSYRSFSSEYAFRMHLRKYHIDESDANKKRELNAEDHSFIEQKLWIQQQLQSQREFVGTAGGSWSCSECDFTSNKRSRFRLHLQKAHTTILMRGPNKHSCFDCRLRFDGSNHLQVHKNCHKIFEVIAPYSSYPNCESCKMYFCNDEDLKTHILRHQEYPELLMDPIIANGIVHKNGEAFVSGEDETETFEDVPLTCGHCLLKFANENACKSHLMLYHLKVFTCPFDSREFPGIPTLSFGNHLRQCHPTIFHDIEIACSFCKMQFDTVYEKLAHMKTCKAKMYQCDHCQKSFFRKTEVEKHLKVALGLMVFACHVCGKRCKDQGDLKIHIRIHTNDRPYPCPHCDKAYKTSSARASHVESHMDQTHECSICNVKFRRRILFQRHMKLLHDDDYRQKCFAENTCSICKKSYLRKTHFRNHMKTHKIE